VSEDDRPGVDAVPKPTLKVLGHGCAWPTPVESAGCLAFTVHALARHRRSVAARWPAGRAGRRGPAAGGDLAQGVRAGIGPRQVKVASAPPGRGCRERLVALADGEGARVVVLVVRDPVPCCRPVAERHVHDLPVPPRRAEGWCWRCAPRPGFTKRARCPSGVVTRRHWSRYRRVRL